jgi:hypothetical protein
MKSQGKQPQISDHQSSWTEDCERLILYADIMGFKERVLTNSHNVLKDSLLDFMKSFKKKMQHLLTGDYLRYVQFSDSIIIVANGTDSKMFNIITKAAVCLIHGAMSHGFPIKGVLSKGVFTFDVENDLYFGKPLVDAYVLHDEIHYYGIVVHHSAESVVKKYIYLGLPYCKERIPLKKGKTAHYHLSWQYFNENLSTGKLSNKTEKWLSQIEETVSGTPRIYVDNTRDVIEKDCYIPNKKAKEIESGKPTMGNA